MIDRTALGLDNEPDHSHPFTIPGISDLQRLARALGGGSYPGLGTGQNDTAGFPDSIAPGFPLTIPVVVPSNMVKQQAYKLSFIPAPYRNYAGSTGISTAPHAHTGDAVQTLSIDHTHGTTNELTGHRHRWFATSGQVAIDPNIGHWTEGHVYASNGNWVNNGAFAAFESDTALGSADLYTETDSSQSQDHAHTASLNGGVSLTSHTHTSISNTGGEQTHIHTGSSAVTEGTSPDNMRVMVDGTDVTSKLGGPWNAQQYELDITPFMAAIPGVHSVQVLSATQLGRVTGWVRQSNIVNALSP